jgi:DNA-binding NarL/FixJ family response regulator
MTIIIDRHTAKVEPMSALEALEGRRKQRRDTSVWLLVQMKHADPNDLANASQLGSLPFGKQLHNRLQDVLREIAAEIRQPNRLAAPRPSLRPAHATVGSAPDLTSRQVQIVDMIRHGCSNKEIARTLGLSLGTIKTHVHAIFTALGVFNRVQLAMHPGLGASPKIAGIPTKTEIQRLSSRRP